MNKHTRVVERFSFFSGNHPQYVFRLSKYYLFQTFRLFCVKQTKETFRNSLLRDALNARFQKVLLLGICISIIFMRVPLQK